MGGGVRGLGARADHRDDPDHAGRHRRRRARADDALVAFGGANADVVAAVLIYRFLTMVPTLALGGLAALTWRWHKPARRPS